MFRLRTGYFIGGIATGLALIFSFIFTLPDGKLHLYFCDVGQGDAAYVRFPDGRDMLVDGGPNDKVLGCLGKYMPFWDRHINIVLMTHPQRDHLQGLIAVLDRYDVDYFVRSDIDNATEGYQELQDVVKKKNIPVKFATRGETISVASTTLSVLWPSSDQIARMKPTLSSSGPLSPLSPQVLGSQSTDLNDGSIVFWLRYGSFDALFTGDADTHVEENYRNEVALRLRSGQALNVLEVLKVPHHGSKTGISETFIQRLKPKLAVISVGKNSYGHPNAEIINRLADTESRVLRTDQEGDIEVVSDGKNWIVETGKNKYGIK